MGILVLAILPYLAVTGLATWLFFEWRCSRSYSPILGLIVFGALTLALAAYIYILNYGQMAWNHNLPDDFKPSPAANTLIGAGTIAMMMAIFVLPALAGALTGQILSVFVAASWEPRHRRRR